MYDNQHLPGEPARVSGTYEERSDLGSPTGVVLHMKKGDLLPALPIGFTWHLVARRRISELNAAELRARAAEFRGMATTATTAETRDALLRIARRFSDLANERDST